MNTPTPITDSAWAKTFEDDEDQCRAGNAASQMRDECAKIERELTTLTAERDQLNEMFHQIRLKLTSACGDPYKMHDEALDGIISERDQLRAAIEEMPTCRCDRSTSQQCELSAKVATLTAERDELRAEVENEARWAEHYLKEARAAEAERDQLRAEVERLRSDRDCEKRLRKDADEFRENAIERAERAEAAETVALARWNGALERALKAEADLAALAQCHDDNCRAVVRLDAELAAAKERLRSEAMDDYASIKDLQRELATERENAERYRLATLKLDAELAAEREKVRLLKFDKDRLDWYNGESYYQFGKSHKCMDSGWWWSCGYQQNNGKSGIQNIRDTIDSAMAHSKSGRNKYNVCKRIEDSIKEDAK
jgi:hypothetical protein